MTFNWIHSSPSWWLPFHFKPWSENEKKWSTKQKGSVLYQNRIFESGLILSCCLRSNLLFLLKLFFSQKHCGQTQKKKKKKEAACWILNDSRFLVIRSMAMRTTAPSWRSYYVSRLFFQTFDLSTFSTSFFRTRIFFCDPSWSFNAAFNDHNFSCNFLFVCFFLKFALTRSNDH